MTAACPRFWIQRRMPTLLSTSQIPSTQIVSQATGLPRWYFLFARAVSSITMTLPGPPTFGVSQLSNYILSHNVTTKLRPVCQIFHSRTRTHRFSHHVSVHLKHYICISRRSSVWLLDRVLLVQKKKKTSNEKLSHLSTPSVPPRLPKKHIFAESSLCHFTATAASTSSLDHTIFS